MGIEGIIVYDTDREVIVNEYVHIYEMKWETNTKYSYLYTLVYMYIW